MKASKSRFDLLASVPKSHRRISTRQCPCAGFLEGDQTLIRFIPKRQSNGCEALNQSQTIEGPKFRKIADDFWETVKGNSTHQMMHVVETDIPAEPAQDRRKVVIRTPEQRCLLSVPPLRPLPVCGLERAEQRRLLGFPFPQ